MKSALELSAKFGKPWESVEAYHAFEQEHMTLYQGGSNGVVIVNGFPFPRIYCNKAIVEKLDLTIRVLHHLGLSKEIKTFDGCFNVRKIRGREDDPDAYSIHSFGLALDFNAAEMPLGAPCKWSKEFLAVWKALGWTNGGEFERQDFMHMEYTDL